jgi:hypothetical protein
MNPVLTESDKKRFWSKISKAGDCWLWQAGRFGSGYGMFKVQGKNLGAHRVAYELQRGPIPDGRLVLHRCDNPACCNPGHLFLGTHADNTADKCAKNRQAKGPTHGSQTKPGTTVNLCGEQHGRAKLTLAQVTEIRRLHAAGTTQRALSARFGVVLSAINKIVLLKAWKP